MNSPRLYAANKHDDLSILGVAGFTGSGVICLGEMKLCGIVCFGVVSRELANTLLDCHSAKKTKKKEKQTAR